MLDSSRGADGAHSGRRVVAVLIGALAGIVLVIAPAASPAPPVSREPLIELVAPSRAAVGKPITLTLRVRGAATLAGYEATLLFDRRSAELVAIDHRSSGLARGSAELRELGPAELAKGWAFGSYSCSSRDCASRGPREAASRTVALARLVIRAKRPGALELRLADARLVAPDGSTMSAAGSAQTITVRIGPGGRKIAAPRARPSERRNATAPRVRDATGDAALDAQDVTAAALAWMNARERGTVCTIAARPRSDVNKDGCVDVSDVQAVAAAVEAGGGAARLSRIFSATKAMAAAAANPPFTVDSTGDEADAAPGNGVCRTSSGTCTLRAAITEANAQAGEDTIGFAIAGAGVKTIQLASSLPTISDTTGGTTIDGYTQAGAVANTDSLASNAQLKIEVRGTGQAGVDGLTVTSANNVIRGLALFNLRRVIYFYQRAATGNGVFGCFVGTNAAGTFAHTITEPSASGVSLYAGAGSNRIGDTSPEARNVISGNARHGIVTYNAGSDRNLIYNNIIGLSPSGQQRLPNLRHGIDVNADSSFNVIGGTGSGMRNVISGNGVGADFDAGIELSHGVAIFGNQVIGNYIGADINGGAGAASWTYNDNVGVRIEDNVRETLVSGNVIVNNRSGGIKIDAPGTSGNVIENNRIGITASGQPGPNANYGINISVGATNNRIGPGNTIAHNTIGISLDGVTTDRNTITRNSIFGNDGLGIDIEPLWSVNPNDAGDSDSGPNEQLNFPVLSSATTTSVSGVACGACTVEVFVADGDLRGAGEGRTYLGSATADGGGAFTLAISGVSAGEKLTATATDGAGNTSEFSPNVTVQTQTVSVPGAPSLTSATFADGRVTLQWSPPASNGGATITNYRIYRGTASGAQSFLTQVGNVSSFTDSGVAAGTTYYYRVSAVNSVGEGGLSNERSVTVPGTTVDTELPKVAFSSPAEGATVNGTVVVSGTASDNVQVATVELKVDAGAYQPASGTTSWSISLDTRPYSDGSHTLTVKAVDSAGNTRWATRSLTFANGAGDTELPKVAFSSPAEGATVSGTVVVSGTASDNVQVATVELKVDGGAYQPASGTTSWSMSLDTRAYSDGGHTLTVKVVDSSGNTRWATRAITTNNSGSSGATAPGPPVNLTAQPAGGKGVSLAWSPPSSDGGSAITTYRIYRVGTFLASVTGTTYKDTATTRDTSYTYWVTAVNGVGEGPASNSATATAT